MPACLPAGAVEQRAAGVRQPCSLLDQLAAAPAAFAQWLCLGTPARAACPSPASSAHGQWSRGMGAPRPGLGTPGCRPQAACCQLSPSGPVTWPLAPAAAGFMPCWGIASPRGLTCAGGWRRVPRLQAALAVTIGFQQGLKDAAVVLHQAGLLVEVEFFSQNLFF